MEIDNYMTAREFAQLVNTPYPTVAQWLRDGRILGAELTDIGHLKVWMIPKDVLKDFKRPEMGRPSKKPASRSQARRRPRRKERGRNDHAQNTVAANARAGIARRM